MMIEPKITQGEILVGALILTTILILGWELGKDIVGGLMKVFGG